ncbi:hypothetical protein PMZ80_002425 [Knufia obscura]|uniref:Uncharacterized protein n=2 Tax=Knufia TaxID=430999 RepID=A0AAN8I2F2_9EURO|nr:hypothetical protein PMZ80_002425 [Knufia obscura]KAK5948574.1 hypothetical protein OHC33_010333 [Knufia fluminis]
MPTKRKPAQKQKDNKKKERPSLTPSEQEILDRLPPPGELTRKVLAKDKVAPTYLLYVVLHTTFERPPQVIIRKTYESQFEALEAFRREYDMWITGDAKTGLFPRRHTEQQLASSYLFNIMEMNKRKTAAPEDIVAENKYRGRGKVEYTIVHRDDADLEDDDHSKRRCVVVCEETTSEKM